MRSRPREKKTWTAAAASWGGAAGLHALLLAAACAATAAWVGRAPRREDPLPVRLELGGTGRAGDPGLPSGREGAASSRPAVPADAPGELDPGEPVLAEATLDGLPAAEGRSTGGRRETGDVGLPDHAGRGRVGGTGAGTRPGGGSGGTETASGPATGPGTGQGGASGTLNPAGDGGEGGDGWSRRRGGRLPSYPAAARRRGWEGTARLSLEVDDKGAVTSVVVAESSGHKLLDDAAEEAAWTWVFEPATTDGRNVASRVAMPVTFRLTD